MTVVAPGAKVVYYAQPYGPRLGSGDRTKIGPEHAAPSFADARRHLDWLGKFGLVYRWTEQTREQQLVAKRRDDGSWWHHPDRGWVELEPGAIPEHPATPDPPPPAPAGSLPVEIAARAAVYGHTVTADPAPLSVNERWRCHCGEVVLRDSAGRVFGTALTTPCPGPAVRPSTAS